MLKPRPRRAAFVAVAVTIAAILVVDRIAGASASAIELAAAEQQPAAEAPSGAVAKPWPQPDETLRLREAAEKRPLFASTAPLSFRLVADFKAVQRDRDPASTVTFPATLIIAGADGAESTIAVRTRTRGHSRRKPTACTFAPLRLEFPENPSGTAFEGQKNLKLGTHCRDQGDVSRYVIREYPIYRMYNLLTPYSFRARLADVTYVDARSQKPIGVRTGLLLEDDDEMARRMGGRISDERGLSFRRADPATTQLMAIFQYMIGNTDMSIASQHNVQIVETRQGIKLPVPYDFDYAGVVDARYAVPDPQFRLGSVRERLYRGPCLTAAQLESPLAPFRAARSELLAVYDAIPALTPGDVRSAKSYLEQFFRTIDRPESIKKAFIDDCGGRGRM